MSGRLRVLMACAITAASLLVLGCAPAGPASDRTAPTEPKASQITAGPQQGQTPSLPTPTATASSALDATGVDAEGAFDRVAAKVPSAKLVKVYTEDDDPNQLLGRPNGYTSKIAFSDSRIPKEDLEFAAKDAIERGGSIEVYADAAGAEARAKYIQQILKSTALGSEYDYVKGPVLVRVTGDLSPRKAKEYLAALD